MITWLEPNPLGRVLALIAGGLFALMVALGVIWSLPPDAASDAADDGDEPLQVEVPHLLESQPIESYAVVTERPVFNESRLPELESDADAEDEGAAEEEEVQAPELELAGVVITPSVRMVTLREKNAKQSLVAFEGQPLEGDYGSWHVSRIAPREITLASGDGRELQLQLEVHDAKIAPPPKPRVEPQSTESEAEQTSAAAAASAEEGQPLTRAEEIRQRIAQRREELRRAAEADRESEQSERNDYKSAIQSMIQAKAQRNDNDNEE